MKKTTTLLFLLFVGLIAKSQILTEDFNYAAGQLSATNSGANTSNGAWTQIPSNNNSVIQCVTGNLTYSGYVTSPVASSGRAVLTNFPVSNLEDISRQFPAAQNSGSVYMAFVLKFNTDSLSSMPSNISNSPSNYFIGLSPYATANSYPYRLYARQGSAAGNVNFGINYGSTTSISWSSDYVASNNFLLVLSYDFVSGVSNDVIKLWVNPATPFSTQPTPTLTVTNTGTDVSDIGRMYLRQSDRTTPVVEVDAITVATSWSTALFTHLVSFDAKAADGKVNLAWATGTEQNASHFELEFSNDAQSFEKIATINAQNNLSGYRYLYTDKQRNNVSFYRLKMVDLNGDFVYSKMVSIIQPSSQIISASPIPATTLLTVRHSFTFDQANVSIIGLDGRKLFTQNVASGAKQSFLDVAHLPTGEYYMVFTADSKTQVIKFVKL
ncbi:MAG: T9SS type A sorting domain-containing protein [Bacteroidetes bacterium]|nr:T9SS type A sorting domain-containing protein [Bacteroidota bacterium]